LGATEDVVPLYRKYRSLDEKDENDEDEDHYKKSEQRNNLAVTFICPDQWIVQMAHEPFEINLPKEKRVVDHNTC
jgi:hypothetical protein